MKPYLFPWQRTVIKCIKKIIEQNNDCTETDSCWIQSLNEFINYIQGIYTIDLKKCSQTNKESFEHEYELMFSDNKESK